MVSNQFYLLSKQAAGLASFAITDSLNLVSRSSKDVQRADCNQLAKAGRKAEELQELQELPWKSFLNDLAPWRAFEKTAYLAI